LQIKEFIGNEVLWYNCCYMYRSHFCTDGHPKGSSQQVKNVNAAFWYNLQARHHSDVDTDR
jgi:hypothetical protein